MFDLDFRDDVLESVILLREHAHESSRAGPTYAAQS